MKFYSTKRFRTRSMIEMATERGCLRLLVNGLMQQQLGLQKQFLAWMGITTRHGPFQ